MNTPQVPFWLCVFNWVAYFWAQVLQFGLDPCLLAYSQVRLITNRLMGVEKTLLSSILVLSKLASDPIDLI